MVKDDGGTELVYFLPNKYSTALMKGGDMHNQMVTVAGVYYEDAHMMDVEMYQVGDQKYDGSVSRRIENLHDILVERARQEIYKSRTAEG